MKPLLFRFKIASLSLLISGLLVIGFGVFFLVVIGKVGMARVDQEIKALGETQLSIQHPLDHWAGFDRSLEFIYGDDRADRIAVRVCDADNEVLFESDHWPVEFDENIYPTLAFELRPVGQNAFRGYQSRGGPLEGEPIYDVTPFVVRLDHDGKVSRNEFDGPEEHFGAFDRNTDGYISKTEATQVPIFPATLGGGGLPPRQETSGGDLRRTLYGEQRPTPTRMKISVFQTLSASGNDWRVSFMGNDSIKLTVAVDLSELRGEAAFFRKVFFAVVPLALLGLAAGGWFIASRALRPVAIITRTAEAITARGLDQRVPRTAADAELQRLEHVINSMLDRLERSFHQAARFSADAAHELQTPLTVLQGELDNAIQQADAGSEEQQRYSLLLQEVSGLKAMVQKLLLLARADVGQLVVYSEDVDLSSIATSAVEDLETMATNLTLEFDIPDNIHVKGDMALIGQIVRNMTTNAMKYSSKDGNVRLSLAVCGEVARLTLANTVSPILEEDQEKIFTRFYRIDKARSREIGGTGLGLSLAREIARAHSGDLVLDKYHDGMVCFALTLPCG